MFADVAAVLIRRETRIKRLESVLSLGLVLESGMQTRLFLKTETNALLNGSVKLSV